MILPTRIILVTRPATNPSIDAGADAAWMARALRLARCGWQTTHPNPRVGCVLVRAGEVIGEGWHHRAGEPHAEVLALRQATAATPDGARGAVAYVTLEPCCHHGRTPPCTQALITSGVARVVTAMTDPNPRVAGGGHEALRAAGLEVRTGVLEAEALALNAGFVQRMRTGRPRLRLKWGASLDGRTALADGRSQWITGVAARRDVQRQRAAASVVLSSAQTVLADGARLNVRLSAAELGSEAPVRQPVRVVLDTHLRLPPSGPWFEVDAPLWLIHGAGLADSGPMARRARALQQAGAELLAVPLVGGKDSLGRLDLGEMLAQLAAREVNEVWAEAGATLGGALLAGGWVDELLVYLAPRMLGHAARPLAVLDTPPGALAERSGWQFVDSRFVGEDLRLTLRPAATPGVTDV